MHIEWIVIHLLLCTGSALASDEEGKEEEQEDLKVFDWQPQQVHIAFGGKLNVGRCILSTQ